MPRHHMPITRAFAARQHAAALSVLLAQTINGPALRDLPPETRYVLRNIHLQLANAIDDLYDAQIAVRRRPAWQEIKSIYHETVKEFIERFPDLAKYAPADQAAMNVVATTDLMDKLKAASFRPAA